MQVIKATSIDPSLNNWGIARAEIDIGTMTPKFTNIQLAQTESRSGKQVRKNSDDLRRARELQGAMVLATTGVQVIIAEVPQGCQSARGAMSNGICVGVLASARVPIIEVSPIEAKLASVGSKTASKEEMIAWAHGLYPELPWLKTKRKGQMELVAANEHIADAIAIMHAGIRTEQFLQLIAMLQGFGSGTH